MVTSWIILCMEFSRQEHWIGLPFSSPGDLPNPGIEPASPTLQADSLSSKPLGRPLVIRQLMGNSHPNKIVSGVRNTAVTNTNVAPTQRQSHHEAKEIQLCGPTNSGSLEVLGEALRKCSHN